MTPTPGWTPGDVATIVLWVCAAISTVAGAITEDQYKEYTGLDYEA